MVSMPGMRQPGRPPGSAKDATISASPVTAAPARRKVMAPITMLAISRPTLDLGAAATAADVLRAAQPYVIQQTDLIGTYHR